MVARWDFLALAVVRCSRSRERGNEMQSWTYSASIAASSDRPRSAHLCPDCGGTLRRVHRRFVDRLFSPGFYRYRCKSWECQWTGNLPIDHTSAISLRSFRALVAAFVIFIVAGLAFNLFTIHRDRVENAALSQNPSITQPLVTIDDPQKLDEAPAVSAGAVTDRPAQGNSTPSSR